MKIDLNETIKAMPEEISESDLLEKWCAINIELQLDPDRGQEALIALARDITLYTSGQLEPSFGGGWRWNLSQGVVRSICVTTFLSSFLLSCGITGITPLFLPAVIPLLFDLEKVKLERSDERVLSIFGARSNVFDRLGDPISLYNSLPPEVRGIMNYTDFLIFLNNSFMAGNAKKHGDCFEILSSGETVFRLSIR